MLSKMILKIIKQSQNQNLNRTASHQVKSEALEKLIADDVVAQQTEWTPCKLGGSNFKTRDLVEVSRNQLEYKPVFISKLIPSIFMLHGGLFVLGSFFIQDSTGNSSLFPLVFASFGVLIGYFLWSKLNYPIRFDLLDRIYWTGSKDPRSSKVKVHFDEIHAIQLVAEHVLSQKRHSRHRMSKRAYRSIELNFILKDGKRLNVIDHSHLSTIRADAQRLSELIEVPIWDAIEP